MIFQKKVEEIYKARVFGRCDDTGRVKYFAPEEFEGLTAKPYSFPNANGETLAGWFYSREGYDNTRLVVFDHGLGGGHRSYMKEIDQLTRHGYLVFTYDHTGCMASAGAHTNGLAQSLSDLDRCLSSLKAAPDVNTEDISVIGHSWGGFAAMNIAALHPDVKRVVGFAGFVSVEEMVKQSFHGILGVYRGAMMKLEREANPQYSAYRAEETLANTTAKVLLFHSRDDGTVSCKRHFGALTRALEGKENITFVTVENRGHNPNYTEDAVAYKQLLYKAMKKLPREMTEDEKTAFRTSFDWDRMTAQDDEVWSRVFAFLSKSTDDMPQ